MGWPALGEPPQAGTAQWPSVQDSQEAALVLSRRPPTANGQFLSQGPGPPGGAH